MADGFKHAPRRKPYANEMKIIIQRMFKVSAEQTADYTIAGMMKLIMNHGRCECGCKTWLKNKPFDFDHGYKPHEWIAIEDYAKTIDWRVLYRPCHKLKTKTVDMPRIVKARRVARKHGIDRETNPITRKKKEIPSPANYEWPSRPMQTKKSKRFDNTRYLDADT